MNDPSTESRLLAAAVPSPDRSTGLAIW